MGWCEVNLPAVVKTELWVKKTLKTQFVILGDFIKHPTDEESQQSSHRERKKERGSVGSV